MYSRDRMTPARFPGLLKSSGAGTLPVTGTASSGDVPQVTVGAISFASITTSLSDFASGSVFSDRQYLSAISHSSPFGARGRSLTYSNVVSSGAINPALAPPSIDILQRDILASMDILSIAAPANSMTHPVPPAVPIVPII